MVWEVFLHILPSASLSPWEIGPNAWLSGKLGTLTDRIRGHTCPTPHARLLILSTFVWIFQVLLLLTQTTCSLISMRNHPLWPILVHHQMAAGLRPLAPSFLFSSFWFSRPPHHSVPDCDFSFFSFLPSLRYSQNHNITCSHHLYLLSEFTIYCCLFQCFCKADTEETNNREGWGIVEWEMRLSRKQRIERNNMKIVLIDVSFIP